MISLAGLGFAEVIGVEISEALVRIAAQNVERLGLERVRLVHSDAASFTDLDRVTHIYMYNPFPCAVVAQVLVNLRASLRRVDRELTMVYRNPVCDGAIVGSQVFQQCETIRPDQHTWAIYRHVPAGR